MAQNIVTTDPSALKKISFFRQLILALSKKNTGKETYRWFSTMWSGQASSKRSLSGDGIRLTAMVDKGRTARLQTSTNDLVTLLRDYARSGDALERYRESFARARRPMRDDIPTNPLLFLPVQTSVMIYADLKKAGIPIETMEGKLDFHACRTAFINMVIESGVSIKEMQALARHKRIETTIKHYARAKSESQQIAVNAMSDKFKVKLAGFALNLH